MGAPHARVRHLSERARRSNRKRRFEPTEKELFESRLNAIRVVADYLVHAGVVAEIALGIIYGSPLASLLPLEWETTFTALGYLGLILVVFEGMWLDKFRGRC